MVDTCVDWGRSGRRDRSLRPVGLGLWLLAGEVGGAREGEQVPHVWVGAKQPQSAAPGTQAPVGVQEQAQRAQAEAADVAQVDRQGPRLGPLEELVEPGLRAHVDGQVDLAAEREVRVPAACRTGQRVLRLALPRDQRCRAWRDDSRGNRGGTAPGALVGAGGAL